MDAMKKALAEYERLVTAANEKEKEYWAGTKGVDPDDKEAWNKAFDASYPNHLEANRLNEQAEKVKYDALEPFHNTCNDLSDRLAYGEKVVSKYKAARQKLWNQELKFENITRRVIWGLLPKRATRDHYHMDFE